MGFSLIPSRPFDYVLEQHRGQDQHPTFRLRFLSSKVFSDLTDLLQNDAAKAIFIAASVGLVGWSGVDADGQVVDFVPAKDGKRRIHGIEVEGGADEQLVARLPFEVLQELGAEVLKANRLDRDTVGNSSSPLPSS